MTVHKNQASPLPNACGPNKIVHAAGKYAASRQREPLPSRALLHGVGDRQSPFLSCSLSAGKRPSEGTEPCYGSPAQSPPLAYSIQGFRGAQLLWQVSDMWKKCVISTLELILSVCTLERENDTIWSNNDTVILSHVIPKSDMIGVHRAVVRGPI